MIDVEFEGRAAIDEVSKLREACRRMKEVSLIWKRSFSMSDVGFTNKNIFKPA